MSRQIKQLEERLGVTLFIRHAKGLTLTSDGCRVLEIIQPLLQQKACTRYQLGTLAHATGKPLIAGLTTAFEQGIFVNVANLLRQPFGQRLRIERASSPKLMQKLRRGVFCDHH